jgi:hypothetical protein
MKSSEKTKYKHVYKVKNNTSVNNLNTQYYASVFRESKYFDDIKCTAKWIGLYENSTRIKR